MSISVICTSCGKKYRLKDELEGKKFRCKGCEQVLVVTESPQPARMKQTKSADQSAKRRPSSSDDQSDRQRRKRKKKPVADPYAHGDDLFGSALDQFDGDYGENFPEDDNPYRAPSHQGSVARRRSTSSEPLTMAQKLFSFEGRISRNTFWLCTLIHFLVALLVVGFMMFTPELVAGVACLLILLPLFWSGLAVEIKRWHDRDKSGWMIFVTLIPVIGGWWRFIECGFLAGTPGPNSYGPDPE